MLICDVRPFFVLPKPSYLTTPSLQYSSLCAKQNRKCKCNGKLMYGDETNFVNKESNGKKKERCADWNFKKEIKAKGSFTPTKKNCYCFNSNTEIWPY